MPVGTLVPSAEALSHITISLVRLDVRASTFSTFCLKRSTRLCVTTTIPITKPQYATPAQCNRATNRVLSCGHECSESRSSALRRPASRRSRDGFRRRGNRGISPRRPVLGSKLHAPCQSTNGTRFSINSSRGRRGSSTATSPHRFPDGWRAADTVILLDSAHRLPRGCGEEAPALPRATSTGDGSRLSADVQSDAGGVDLVVSG